MGGGYLEPIHFEECSMDPNLFAIDGERLLEVLFAIIFLSFLVERALAVVYENRWFLEKTKGHSVKEFITFGVSFAVCRSWDFDALSVLFVKEKTMLWGHVITAAIVAGGSKASIKLFQDVLDIKSNAERERLAIIEAQRKALEEKARVQTLVTGAAE
jgi:hypothetical protein